MLAAMIENRCSMAETKGTMSSMELREIEKIKCSRKFFAEINGKIKPDNVRYDVVNSYGKSMEIVRDDQ